MKIVFLGTNGWYSTGTGNTPCVLVDTKQYYLIFDAGDGIQSLDKHITANKPVYLFLSHFHLEHIHGLHILPKFRLQSTMHIFGQPGTKAILGRLIDHPFTAPLHRLQFKIEVNDLTEGTHHVPFPVTCKPLVHADPCFGYRVELDGKTIAFCTDTGVCDNAVALGAGADLLIHECAFKSGQHSDLWPHTNPEQAGEVARRAGARTLALFHFDAYYYRTLEERKEAERVARTVFPNTVAAMDGMELEV
ncbi:MAG: ribonuclease Z [Chloroflexi bacterium]|nr:ribonuclease Z [Chloroflexota bacterium]